MTLADTFLKKLTELDPQSVDLCHSDPILDEIRNDNEELITVPVLSQTQASQEDREIQKDFDATVQAIQEENRKRLLT